MQVRWPRQREPQPPQLSLSVVVSTQSPPQRENPAPQATLQTPLLQRAVPFITLGQALPHLPQFEESVFVLKQASPQRL
jgi:hypothetical protein